MKCTYANFQAIYETSLDLEIIQQDNKAAKPVVVAAMEEVATPEYDDEEMEAINAVRAHNGQNPQMKGTN
jgi:hypothetical protein